MGSPEFARLCLKYRGRILTGKHAHACEDWDFLPIDETCDEWPCVCCRSGGCGVSMNAEINEDDANHFRGVAEKIIP
jgi:hypothetical protein